LRAGPSAITNSITYSFSDADTDAYTYRAAW
jgi:hypothetical protein